MFAQLKKVLGSEAAVEKLFLESAPVKRALKELSAQQATRRQELLAELAALEQREARELPTLARKRDAAESAVLKARATAKAAEDGYFAASQAFWGVESTITGRRGDILRELRDLPPATEVQELLADLERAQAELQHRVRGLAESAWESQHLGQQLVEVGLLLREAEELAHRPVDLAAEGQRIRQRLAEVLASQGPPRPARKPTLAERLGLPSIIRREDGSEYARSES